MIHTPDTSKARTLFSGDWDENGTCSVSLPDHLAPILLEQRGWTLNERGHWVAPDGFWTWHTDEALQIALASEVL